jgi:flagellar basal body-associated protein FliL
MFSTGGDGGGAALFLLIVSLPVGLVVSVVGLVMWLTNRSRK